MKAVSIITRFVDRVSIFVLLGAFLAIFIISAIAYTVLGHFGHGLEPVGNPGSISFLDSLYFSIVTISSLGYGDIHPVGYSRAVASMEVIAGLFIIGLAISKVASERTGYLLRRIYSSDVQQRLKYFSDAIDRCERLLAGDTNHNTEDWTNLVNEGFAIINGAKKFIGFEVYHGTMFELVPPKAFRNLVSSISRLLKSIVSQVSQRGVTGKPRRTVKNMLKLSKGLAHTLSRNSDNEELIDLCEELQKKIANHREQMNEPLTAISTEHL